MAQTSQDHFMNHTEKFRKYRFKPITRTFSDKHIVCKGRLVESSRQPERFYKGWYPIRQCSNEHKPQIAAGMKTVKSVFFQNYHVKCDVCDMNPQKDKRENRKRSYGSSGCPSVCSSDCSCVSRCSSEQRHLVNAHWRSHDPHPMASRPSICDTPRVHKSNWFVEQINLEILNRERKKTWKMLERLREPTRKSMGDLSCKQNGGQLKSSGTKLKETPGPLLKGASGENKKATPAPVLEGKGESSAQRIAS